MRAAVQGFTVRLEVRVRRLMRRQSGNPPPDPPFELLSYLVRDDGLAILHLNWLLALAGTPKAWGWTSLPLGARLVLDYEVAASRRNSKIVLGASLVGIDGQEYFNVDEDKVAVVQAGVSTVYRDFTLQRHWPAGYYALIASVNSVNDAGELVQAARWNVPKWLTITEPI